jgi:hypothetical protein
MILELSLFLLEFTVGTAYPLFMTVKTAVVGSERPEETYRSWVFYWASFIVLQNLSWYLDSFVWTLLRTVALVLLALPQLRLSLVATNIILGPLSEQAAELLSTFGILEKKKLE